MNERQAKKKMKKQMDQEIDNYKNQIDQEIDNYKNQIDQKIDNYKRQLEELQEEFNRNLDEDLIPINEEEARRISARIQEINRYYYKALEEKNSLKEKNKNNQTISDGDDGPTIELPTKEIKEEIDKSDDELNIKIECDLKNGFYRIYSQYSKLPNIHVVSKDLLNPNSPKYIGLVRELKNKYGNNINIDDLDLNIVEAFEEFDRKYNTSLQEEYINNTFKEKIIYDVRKFRLFDKSVVNNNFLNSKEKSTFIAKAKNYKKYHENCEIVTNKKAAVMLGVGISTVGALGLAALGISSINSKDNSDNINESTTIESTIEEDLEKSDKLPEILTTESKQDVKDNITTEELLEGMPIDAHESDIVYFDEDEDRVIRVGDIIDAKEMENINLYRLPTDVEPVGNTARWPAIAAYKFAGICPTDVTSSKYISVKVNGKLIETAIRSDNISTKDLKKILDEQYGPGYNIRLHVMALDENKNVINDRFGWVDLDELTKEYKNAMIK